MNDFRNISSLMRKMCYIGMPTMKVPYQFAVEFERQLDDI